MIKNAILLHGKPGKKEYYDPKFPSPSNYHWFPWLQKQLLIQDIKADTPEVPYAYEPQWELWTNEVERFDIKPNTILVGHSCGGGFWIRYLSEHPEVKVGKVILVAPWLDPTHARSGSFFKFEIDKKLIERVKELVIFNSDDDDKDIHTSVEMIKSAIPAARIVEFHKMGHFTHEDMNVSEFPELLEECLA